MKNAKIDANMVKKQKKNPNIYWPHVECNIEQQIPFLKYFSYRDNRSQAKYRPYLFMLLFAVVKSKK